MSPDYYEENGNDDNPSKIPHDDGGAGFELIFTSIDDMIDFTDDSKQVCIIAMPKLEEVYQYEKNIGKGSQASIDVYKHIVPSRSTADQNERGGTARVNT